jgi:Flp pilus assembly protein TadB
MMLNRGDILCVAGNWELHKSAMAWFWPSVVGGVALTAVVAQVVASRRVKQQQQQQQQQLPDAADD